MQKAARKDGLDGGGNGGIEGVMALKNDEIPNGCWAVVVLAVAIVAAGALFKLGWNLL